MRPGRLIILLLLCASWAVKAQVSELGITGGLTYYIGDLNTKHYYNAKPAFGLVYRYNFNERYAFRLQGLYSRLEAFDSDSPDPNAQYRNLSFTTSLIEVAGLLEINFFPYRAGKEKKSWTPFIFLGAAYFRVNPQADLNGVRFDLAPLGTEGQGTSAGANEPYALDNLAYPFGAGLKFNLKRVDIQLEWGLAVPLRKLQEAFTAGNWYQFLIPAAEALGDWYAIELSPDEVEAVRHGHRVKAKAADAAQEKVRGVSTQGELVALMMRMENTEDGSIEWQPKKVFFTSD